MTVDEIKELMRAFTDCGLSELKMEQNGFKLRLACAQDTAVHQKIAVQAIPVAVPEKREGKLVCSPIVGTFYNSSSPEAEPFAEVGTTVHRGDTLFIIESMKLMNEVTSEFDGVVTEIFTHSGETVEYAQPLMRIEQECTHAIAGSTTD